MRGLVLMAMVVLAALVLAPRAQAGALPEFQLTLKDHQFVPATLKVPANTKFKVLVTNHNPTPSEFESTDFNREKIVLPNSTITVFIGPLDKGSYTFYDDFDHATTGVLVVE